MAILYFWVKNMFFLSKIVSSLETSGPLQKQQSWVNKTFSENLSLIRSFFQISQVLEYKVLRNKCEWCKTFLRSI